MSRRRTSEARARLAVDTREEFSDLPTEPLTVRVSTAVKLTGIPRTTLYELIRDGLRGDNYDGRLSGNYDGR